jgi:hypothetical protein
MNTEVLVPRVKSFLWRLSGMIAVAVLSFGIENASELNIPSYGVVLGGLLVGEITKYLNS